MRNAAAISLAVSLLQGLPAMASEPVRGCYRTVAEAIAQARATDAETTHLPELHSLDVASALAASAEQGSMSKEGLSGFRVDSLRRDPLVQRTWATVSRCEHPERPAVTVEVSGVVTPADGLLRGERPTVTAQASTAQAIGNATVPAMLAGTAVRVVSSSENLRMEFSGVAQSNGALGERVRVRLVRPGVSGENAEGSGAPEQIITAVVRGKDLLEMER